MAEKTLDIEAILDRESRLPGQSWIVANGLQVWIDGHNACASPRICTVQNASLPVLQLSKNEMAAVADFIAHARQDIPDLLARIAEMEAENVKLKEAVQWAIDTSDNDYEWCLKLHRRAGL